MAGWLGVESGGACANLKMDGSHGFLPAFIPLSCLACRCECHLFWNFNNTWFLSTAVYEQHMVISKEKRGGNHWTGLSVVGPIIRMHFTANKWQERPYFEWPQWREWKQLHLHKCFFQALSGCCLRYLHISIFVFTIARTVTYVCCEINTCIAFIINIFLICKQDVNMW